MDKNQNFEIWAGNSAQIDFAITNSTTGCGMDLPSASSVIWHLLSDSDTPTPALITKSTGGSGITVSTSTASVVLGPIDTSSLSGVYVHQARVTDTSGSTVTVSIGTVTINKSI